MGNLQPLSEAQKRANRRLSGSVMRWSAASGPAAAEKPKADREMIAPIALKLGKRKQSQSGSRLNPAHRAMVAARKVAREDFFATI